MRHILAFPKFIKAVIHEVKFKTAIGEQPSIKAAIKEELYLCFRIMGVSLYYKYKAGTAVEGVDFKNCE